MDTLEFGPATQPSPRLVAGVRDDQLGDPTPARRTPWATWSTTSAASPSRSPRPPARSGSTRRRRPSADASLPRAGLARPDRRPRQELAEAWRDPSAYDGMTQAGPVDLPGEVAALVALDEVVVHGWDLARATGQPYDVARRRRWPAWSSSQSFEPPADGSDDGGVFGPPSRCPPTHRRSTAWSAPPAATRTGRHLTRLLTVHSDPGDFVGRSRSGTLPRGGVSERPKENASKACVGASPPWVQIPPPPPSGSDRFGADRSTEGRPESGRLSVVSFPAPDIPTCSPSRGGDPPPHTAH